jgi:molecular chaperone DnaK
VVDLGAGTLDTCLLDLDDNVYEVKHVHGDNTYGGRDFDRAITNLLAERLRTEGLDVPAVGLARRRLEIAAESLKMELSSQEEAGYTLNAFLDRPSVRLELTISRRPTSFSPAIAPSRSWTSESPACWRPDLFRRRAATPR